MILSYKAHTTTCLPRSHRKHYSRSSLSQQGRRLPVRLTNNNAIPHVFLNFCGITRCRILQRKILPKNSSKNSCKNSSKKSFKRKGFSFQDMKYFSVEYFLKISLYIRIFGVPRFDRTQQCMKHQGGSAQYMTRRQGRPVRQQMAQAHAKRQKAGRNARINVSASIPWPLDTGARSTFCWDTKSPMSFNLSQAELLR